MKPTAVSVLGSGAWGTALALQAARGGDAVRWWVREPDVATQVREERRNDRFLPGVSIPETVEVVADLTEAVRDAECVVAVVPSEFARLVYHEMKDSLHPDASMVVATKGIEVDTLMLPLDVVADELGSERRRAVLSGPSFAVEVAQAQPTAIVLASSDETLSDSLQERFSSEAFRIYSNDDPVGVQVAGAMKNVIAIAAGVADGLGMGHNTQAALITRGLAEMVRLGVGLGARAETFSGLAGMGDLVLTCHGPISRNRMTGQRLARGVRLDQLRDEMRGHAEGIATTRAIRALAQRLDIETPIVDEVYRILYEDGEARDAIRRLMGRPLTRETRTR